MDHVSVMFALLRAEVCSVRDEEQLNTALPVSLQEELFSLSKSHDLVHIIGHGLQKRKQEGNAELAQKFAYQTKLAICRSALQQRVYDQLCALLEAACIPFIPLKGSVIRNYYPQSWMRTSSDIDILVPEEQLSEAMDRLIAQGYTYQGKEACAVSAFSPTGVHVELHFSLIADYEDGYCDQILTNVWDRANLTVGKAYQYEMPDALFYYYHMAHIARHVRNGGCGVRPVLDTWLLNHRVAHDPAARNGLLAEGGLLTFAGEVEKLAQVWFSGAPHDGVSMQLAAFILGNGVYGTYEQKVAMHQAQNAGKGRHFLSRVFMPYERLKHLYPVLNRHKWLFPFCIVARWCSLLLNGGTKRAARMIKTGNAISEDARLSAVQLLSALGLDGK